MSELDKDIIVCRCEDLTLADVKQLIGKGYRTLDELRRIARLGMGPCQGKTCRALVQRELAAAGTPLKHQLPGTYRPPTRPITLGSIVAGSSEEASKDAH
jgi:bacterioferritin-associated ferredoxin